MKKKILIISGEAWRDESNGGNVLTNLFAPLQENYEFAQIYTNPSLPNNKVCEKYFHLSESEMLHSLIGRKKFGKVIVPHQHLQSEEINTNSKQGVNRFLKKNFIHFALFVQDILWRYSYWKTPDLERFIKEFNPDIIFAPMYYGLHLHRLDRYVAKLSEKKLISYVSDDHLTYRHFSFSPFFWINRLILRKNVLQTAQHYSLLYTMTQEQLDEYQPVLNIPMKVLKKSGEFIHQPIYTKHSSKPIIITYGGNLIYNRYKTLAILAKAIKKLNAKHKNFELHIYTQSPITNKLKKLLHDDEQLFLHGKISLQELEQKYKQSDIVLHVESFDLKQKLLTRLSFSTKIIDLLHSGRCILAICWKESAPYKYFKLHDAAICIDEVKNIEKQLQYLLDNPHTIEIFALKAWECGKINHQKSKIISEFKNDL